MTAATILLLGMPRSGTTWIGKIFDSHPQTIYRHEPDNFTAIRDLPLLTLIEDQSRYQATLDSLIPAMLALRHTKVVMSRPVFSKRYFWPGERSVRSFAAFSGKGLARVLGELRFPEWRDYRAVSDGVPVWKSIESVGRLGTLANGLKGSKTLLLIRHPCGYVASVLRGEARGKFEDGGSSSEDYGVFDLLLPLPEARARGLTMDILKGLTPVERLAWRWVLFNEKAMREIEQTPSAKVFRYEDFCNDPEATTRSAFDFVGLTWDAQTSSFLRASTAGDDQRYYAVVKNPKHAASKWKDELGAEKIEQILRITASSKPGQLYAHGVP